MSPTDLLRSLLTPQKDKKLQKRSLRKLATNIGAVLSLSPRGESLKRFPEEYIPVKRERSKSVGDIVEDLGANKANSSIELCLSDDDDNDDFAPPGSIASYLQQEQVVFCCEIFWVVFCV
jgi:hypothetical protein